MVLKIERFNFPELFEYQSANLELSNDDSIGLTPSNDLLVSKLQFPFLLNTHTFPSTTLKTWKLIDGGNKLYTWSKIDTICPLTRPSKIDLAIAPKQRKLFDVYLVRG